MNINPLLSNKKLLCALCMTLAFGLLLALAPSASAATINVSCDGTELITAINTANANADADTLELSAGCEYTLTNVDNTDATLGPNGLPIITTNITINGIGATIARASGAPAFRFFQINNDAELTLMGTTITNGISSQSGGGGIYNAGTAHIMNSTFLNNRGVHAGGAIFNTGILTISDTTFSENWAPSDSFGLGGGIYNLGTLSIANSTFNENVAVADRGPSEGGAIYSSGTLHIINSTITANTATTGAGISNHGTFDATNSTIVENNADWAGGIDGGGTLNNTIVANNAGLANCSGTFVDGGGNLRFPKSDSSCLGIFANPKLGALEDNGGTTQTMALALDSPAINAANDADCPTTDQRGITRPQGKHCDIGAFELESPSAPTLLAPTQNKKVTKPRVNLKWTAAERVTNYQVIVRIDSVKGKKVVNTRVTTTNFKTLSLESGHWYQWRVKACSQVGCSKTPFWRFRVQ